MLLAVPVGWLVVGYLGSLFVLLLASFWDTNPFTSEVVHNFTLDNFRRIFEQDVYREVAWRTIRMAALVTLADAVLAFPIAYYMARVASPRTRNLLVVAVLMPLWASYLVKAYAWRTILSGSGAINWALDPFGLTLRRLLDCRALACLHVPVAAVHDPADLRGARADPAVAARGIGRPRRTLAAHVLPRNPAARASRRSSPARSSPSR